MDTNQTKLNEKKVVIKNQTSRKEVYDRVWVYV